MKKAGLRKIFIITIIVIGVIVLSYPFISSWYNAYRFTTVAEGYERKAGFLSDETLEKEWQQAMDYNHALEGEPVEDPFVPNSGRVLPKNYLSTLNMDGVMGRIKIPEIDVDLPIYHGTKEKILEKGIGHIEGTALPIGGEDHTILTGHTGLPNAVLFTKLDKLKKESVFYVTVLDKTFEYQVDKTDVILPEEFSFHELKHGEYITLVTCTPYGINSHRLLVRGRLVGEVEGQEVVMKEKSKLWIIILVLLVLIGCGIKIHRVYCERLTKIENEI